ncbi:MAG: T9SS type A sorting domain-containing protein [Flavobacteriales bacterium]|nr:T9SS type A sorting domain-containing protein [Flavobacteriales bacterium]
MKKQLHFIGSLLILSGGAIAQPTLQSSDIGYTAGDSYTLHLCDWEQAGPSGANQTWDFSGVSENNVATIDILDASTTSEASSFPNANVALYVAIQGTYMYFNSGTSNETSYGLSASGTNIPYSDGEIFFTFPLAYGNTNSDNLAASFSNAGYNWNRSGSVTSSVDGYGTLTTPSGTFTDVLRVKIEEDYTDQPVGIPQSANTTTSIYHWYKAGIHYPLLVITEFNSGGAPQYLLQYTDVSTGIKESDFTQVNVYPNPTTDFLRVSGTEFNNGTYEVVDVLGKTVLTGTLTTNQISVNQLPEGFYVLKLVSKDYEVGVSRFQVSK